MHPLFIISPGNSGGGDDTLNFMFHLLQATQSESHLQSIVQLVLSYFSSDDWNVRKAAVESLTSIARSMKLEMTPFKPEVKSTLEEMKHDKV